jgi:transposase
MGQEVVRYSEAFKRHVVEELERGVLRSHGEARERYGIGGAETINGWLRRYGRNHLLGRVVRVESVEERDQIKALKARVRDLERAVADAKVQETLAKAYFEIVCEKHGVTDVEALKKSIAAKLSSEGLRPGER